jgi:hypothetical protein
MIWSFDRAGEVNFGGCPPEQKRIPAILETIQESLADLQATSLRRNKHIQPGRLKAPRGDHKEEGSEKKRSAPFA